MTARTSTISSNTTSARTSTRTDTGTGTAGNTAIGTRSRIRAHTVVESPVGPLTLVATEGRLSGLYMTGQRHRPPEETFGPRDDGEPVFARTAEQLTAYFAGELITFDLPLALEGTPFRRRVWAALQDIPYGETLSYGQLADRLGQPKASRAVGLANGRNPVGIVVPCHRVVGATGSLTGYGGGLDRKRQLLALERGGVPAATAGAAAGAANVQDGIF